MRIDSRTLRSEEGYKWKRPRTQRESETDPSASTALPVGALKLRRAPGVLKAEK